MRLGRRPPTPHAQARLLRLSNYMALPPAPPSADWLSKVTNPGVMLNDSLGDCTCAGLAHAIQVWTAANGNQITVSDADVLKAYEESCGYDPSDPMTDQGGIETSVLNYARLTGVGGHKIGAYVAVNIQDEAHVRSALDLFGGLYLGVALPLSAQQQDVWRVALSAGSSATKGSWGGHCVFVAAYDDAGLTCITWGEKKRMSWDWFFAYCDECYALLSNDWVTGVTPAPSGFDLAALQADLVAVSA
jgi:hypothetical protein